MPWEFSNTSDISVIGLRALCDVVNDGFATSQEAAQSGLLKEEDNIRSAMGLTSSASDISVTVPTLFAT